MIFASLFPVRAVIYWWPRWWAVHLQKMKTWELNTCRALGVQTKLRDVFPVPEFLFKRLHTENVQGKRLARVSLHGLNLVVSFLAAWKMVQVTSSVSHCSRFHPEGHIQESTEVCAKGLWSQFLSMFPKRVHRELFTVQVLKGPVSWWEKARLG